MYGTTGGADKEGEECRRSACGGRTNIGAGQTSRTLPSMAKTVAVQVDEKERRYARRRESRVSGGRAVRLESFRKERSICILGVDS